MISAEIVLMLRGAFVLPGNILTAWQFRNNHCVGLIRRPSGCGGDV